MDLLKTVIGALSGNQEDGNPLISAVLGMLSNGGSQSGSIGNIGGIGELLQRFQEQGMGEQIQSWIGNGENRPVGADQIEQVFGSESLGQLAGQAGLPKEQVSGQLAELLPQIIDRLTPQGQVPEGGLGSTDALKGALGDALGGLFGKR